QGKRVADHGQALYKGGWPRTGHLQGGDRLRPGPAHKGVASYGQGQLAREVDGARKGRQMPVAYKRPPTGATACRGGTYRQKRHSQGLLHVANKGSARP
ncbi:hypothetical protein GW17_00062133, partial [Ensete ventricosum]